MPFDPFFSPKKKPPLSFAPPPAYSSSLQTSLALGGSDYALGLSICANAFPPDTCDHELWKKGWLLAHDEALLALCDTDRNAARLLDCQPTIAERMQRY